MRSSEKHACYSLYKKKTKSGLYWYVRFWDGQAKAYTAVRSTGILVEGKRERRREADDTAQFILAELRMKTLQSNAEPAKSTSALPAPAQQYAVVNTLFTQYLLGFWTPESNYAKYKSGVKKRPLSAYYITMNHDDVNRHIEPFLGFKGIKLGEVSRKLIKEWLIWMSSRKVQRKRKDGTISEGNCLSGRRINAILQGMRVAVRWAVDNEDISVDPFRKLDEAAEESKEKGILTPAELKRLIALPISDPFSRLAVLLAARCGMRRGEIRGLQWGDISEGIITIRHNYVNADGLKSPKIKGGTVVKNSSPVPLTQDVEAVLEMARRYSDNTGASDFVIQSRIKQGTVVSAEYFRSALERELRSIGIDKNAQKERNITFHSLRHNFVTLGRMSGLTDFEIQTLARHKSVDIMERYSHGKQAIDFVEMKRRLEKGVMAS